MHIRQKTGTNSDLTTDPLIEKYQTISIKFRIRISQLVAKIELKQQNLIKPNQTRTSFFIKNYRSISMTFEIKISQFYD